MTSPPPTRRTIVFRASRDTLVLIACTVTVTLALAYSVHQRAASPASQLPQQDWAGRLADVLPDLAPAATPEPMTSDSLVVPKTALALPALSPAASPRTVNKAQACETPPCPVKAAVPLPPTRQKLATTGVESGKPGPEAGAPKSPSPKPNASGTTASEAGAPKRKSQSFALGDLNPLHHLPDTVRRPFSYAGTKISGWFDRL